MSYFRFRFFPRRFWRADSTFITAVSPNGLLSPGFLCAPNTRLLPHHGSDQHATVMRQQAITDDSSTPTPPPSLYPRIPMDPVTLCLSMIFGLIGMAMFSYGKKQQHIVCIATGLALMVFPYFIPSAMWMLILGTLLTFAPYFIAL